MYHFDCKDPVSTLSILQLVSDQDNQLVPEQSTYNPVWMDSSIQLPNSYRSVHCSRSMLYLILFFVYCTIKHITTVLSYSFFFMK